MKSKPTDFWQAFSNALARQGEKLPEGNGWRPFQEWVAASGLKNAGTVSRKLGEGIKAGILERFEGQMFKGNSLERCVWYRNRPTP